MLEVRWKHSGKKLTVDIAQTQPAGWGMYRIPGLEIAIDGKVVRVDVTGRQTHQVVEGISQKPKKIEVDPSGWWLLKSSVRGER
jgi:hypothetical protein